MPKERLLLSSLTQLLSWFRFIDDVDMKWIHSDKELDEFFEHANSAYSFYPNGLAEWDTLNTVLRMATTG
jgi:hypothetical protein